jgi:1-acyl-sn-glycerol-3-phosphate acyltransferase
MDKIMRILHYPQAMLVLIVAPMLTGFISVGAIFLKFVCRAAPESVQTLPRIVARIICWGAGITVTVEGREHLDAEKTYIFAANHQSQFDIPTLQGYLGFDFRWMAKKELFAIPIFGAGMRAAGYISVDRSRGRQALHSLNEAAQKISAGTSVVIFPEGTRSLNGELQPFKSGAMVLAIKARVPIVPVAIIGTHQILAKGKLLSAPGRVVIRLGHPVDTTQFALAEKQELALRLHQDVAGLLAVASAG